ncbi:hypothetical protein [Halorubrum ezzemoulense]|uniref:hypothetical protein n=1 Tax=Halorubrum ezzemoulense TaxID=337243 RepID=UPI00232F7F3F|nr:hypothetical protein [Halorubrum ezzemoulense]MDB9252882.1 hypothetical protein [Halorubrum ezzemoulense]MDB9256734.1 hypothetical protein [Halorubrum ezzemoulense]MDB9277042.1 hypothetical protein [Halorubrum ezzemoulense]
MKRRNVLLGLGASAAGSGIVFGTGAFTQVEANRSLTIGVDEDANALLALDAGSNIASVYNDSNGELVIDTKELSDNNDDEHEGFNVEATVQIGSTGGDFIAKDGSENVPADNDVAFVVTNNFETVEGSSNDEIDVKLDLSSVTTGTGTLYFIGTAYSGTTSTKVANTNDNNEVKFTLEPGDKIHFVIQISTVDTSGSDDFGGEVTFSVVPG